MIYHTKLIPSDNLFSMKKVLLTLFLALVLFPMTPSFSQISDTDPTLAIKLTSFTPFHYRAEDGSTIIIGEVENTKNFPITGVQIWAGFYDDVNLQPLESTIGTTLLKVIPPNEKSPYMIKSPSTNAAISNVSVNLLGFNSAGSKQEYLNLDSGTLEVSDRISYSGKISNNGGVSSENTRVHLIFYDVFQPPRLIKISTLELSEPIEPGASAEFSFDEERLERAVGLTVIAESDNYSSNSLDLEITPPELIVKRISINDVSISDSEGNRLSNAEVNSPIFIQSNIWIQIASEDESYNQDYVYYAQVKQSGKQPFIEFLGTFEGHFEEPGSQIPTIKWVPESKGLYFIETFVWDTNAVPLASKGPIILVLVN